MVAAPEAEVLRVAVEEVRSAVKFAVTFVALAAAVAVLRAGPRKPPNVFLAFFLLMVGSGYAFNAMPEALRDAYLGRGLAIDAFRFEMVFNILDPLVFLYLASIFPRRNALNDARLFAPLGLLVAGLLFEALTEPFQFAPSRAAYYDVNPGGNFSYPLPRLLFSLYMAGCYAAAFVAFARAAGDPEQEEDAPAARIALVGAAIVVVPRLALLTDLHDPAFRMSDALRAYAINRWGLGSIQEAFFGTLPQVAALVMVLALAALAVRWAWRHEGPAARPPFAAALLPPAALGAYPILVGWLAASGLPMGFLPYLASLVQAARWLLVAPLFAYAILHTHVFDVDRRARTSLAVGLVLAVLAVGAALGYGVAGAVGAGQAPPVLAAASVVIGAGAAAGAWPLARRAATHVFPQAADEEFLTERKVEVFRVAIADVRAAGGDPLGDPRLVAFRRRLGLSESAHRSLVAAPIARFAAPAPVLPGTLLFDRYDIQRLLGQGASGRTWLARDVALDRNVAVKQVFGRSPQEGGDRVAAYVREVRAAGAVRHPNVVRVLDARAAGDDSFLILEYVPGGTLAERLSRVGGIPPDEGLQILDGVLAGLEAAHAAGVLHRDVKPSNILLDAEGAPKLADFGVARVPGLEATVTRLGRGPQPGTPRYMAPEQVQGLPVGPPMDVYAAAVVACEALTGKPYQEGAVGRVPGSPELRAVLARALEPRAADRYPTAAEFRRALGAVRPEG